MSNEILLETDQPRLVFIDSVGNVHNIDMDDWSTDRLDSGRDGAILGALIDLVADRYGSHVCR